MWECDVCDCLWRDVCGNVMYVIACGVMCVGMREYFHLQRSRTMTVLEMFLF